MIFSFQFSGIEDRRVRFDINSNAIPRSLSHSDLRTISNDENQISREGRSSLNGLSRDDMSIYQRPNTNHQVSQSVRSTENCQGSSMGFSSAARMGSMTDGNSRRSLGIVHMPSTGILSSGADLGSRLSGRMLGNGSGLGLQSGVMLNTGDLYGGSAGIRSGFSASTGMLSGNSAGMVFSGCRGSCSGNLSAGGAGSGINSGNILGSRGSGLIMGGGGGTGSGSSYGLMIGGSGGVGGGSIRSGISSGLMMGGSGGGGGMGSCSSSRLMMSGGMGTGSSSGLMMGAGMGGFSSGLLPGHNAGAGLMSGYGSAANSNMAGTSQESSGFLSNNGFSVGCGNMGGVAGRNYGNGMSIGMVNGNSSAGLHSQGLSGSGCGGNYVDGQQISATFVSGNGTAEDSRSSHGKINSNSEMYGSSGSKIKSENPEFTSTET